MSESSSSSGGGIGLGGLTFLLFLGLKLTHHIDWSWWWVTSPLWISAGVVATLVSIAGIIALIVALTD